MNNEELPALTLAPMTEEDGRAICEWRYPAPYEMFRWPAWEQMTSRELEFGDPAIRREQYLTVRNQDNGQLVGYVQLFPMEGVVRIGMGLRPDCCGLGWGAIVTKLLLQEARLRQPDAQIDLEVERWNERAIRVYKKAGFVVTDEYSRRATHGMVHVVCMVWNNG